MFMAALTAQYEILRVGDWLDARDGYVANSLRSPVTYLCPLEFRWSWDYRTSCRHSKDPIEWLIRWGWPAPRLVMALNYIAV